MVRLGTGGGAEVVAVAKAGDLAVTCGGFGASIEDVSDPTYPRTIGGATARCQNVAFGPELPDGSRVVYLAHHGDTWGQTAMLEAYRVRPDGAAEPLFAEPDPDILFEGPAFADDHLYVATLELLRLQAPGRSVGAVDSEVTPP